MGLYIALIIIAALGILALLLIFWDQRPRLKQRAKPAVIEETTPVAKEIISAEQPVPQSISEDAVVDYEEELNNLLQQDLPTMRAISPATVDPTLASLGFSALDDLMVVPENVSPLKTGGIEAAKTEPFLPTELVNQSGKQKSVIILYLMAEEGQQFVGYELVQALLSAGLRFGEMNIFHFFADANEQRRALFSIASAVEPGVFDLSDMGAIACPGLSIFMKLSHKKDDQKVFEQMLDIVYLLADDLGGELLDEHRQPLTDELIEEYRQLVVKS